MISWWEVLKASKGLPVSDFYAAMWGKQIAGKYTITELEGPLPLTFNADGTHRLLHIWQHRADRHSNA